tara:strand:+ start:138 stop:1133 length:996 start_codon:yes stop_codon:yes gene_type:complete
MSQRLSANKKMMGEIKCIFDADSGIDLEKINDNEFEVFSSKKKSKFNLNIQADLPENWEDLFTPQEKQNLPFKVGLNYESKDSRKSGFIELKKVNGNSFAEKFSLDFSEWRGRINLKISLIRTKSVAKKKGFLTNEYSELSNSEEYKLDITKKEKPEQGGSLKVDFTSFSQQSVDGETGFAKNSVYFLDTTSEEVPIIYLNSDMSQEALRMFENSGRNTIIAAKRDAIFSGIETDIWEQLATHALQEIRNFGGEIDELSEVGHPYVGICQALTSMLFPGLEKKDAEKQLIDICTDDDNEPFKNLLNTRLPIAVQKKTNLVKSIEKLTSWDG